MSRSKLLHGLHAASVIAACLVAWPDAPRCDEARDAHARGVRLFKESSFPEAADAFREAHRLRPTWKLYFNIGQCEAAAKRYGLAIEAFEAYLVEGGDEVPADRIEIVTSEIIRMKPLVGMLEIAAPRGLDVFVDGHKRAVTPPNGPVRVAAGKHDLVLRDGGEAVFAESVNIGGGITTRIEMKDPEETEPAPPVVVQLAQPPQPAPQPQPPPEKRRSPMWGWGWASFSVGFASAVLGTLTGVAALSKDDELAKACPDESNCSSENEHLKNEAENLALATDIMLPVGIALATTGIVLVILGREKKSVESETAGIGVLPLVGHDRGGLMIEGRF